MFLYPALPACSHKPGSTDVSEIHQHLLGHPQVQNGYVLIQKHYPDINTCDTASVFQLFRY